MNHWLLKLDPFLSPSFICWDRKSLPTNISCETFRFLPISIGLEPIRVSGKVKKKNWQRKQVPLFDNKVNFYRDKIEK